MGLIFTYSLSDDRMYPIGSAITKIDASVDFLIPTYMHGFYTWFLHYTHGMERMDVNGVLRYNAHPNRWQERRSHGPAVVEC